MSTSQTSQPGEGADVFALSSPARQKAGTAIARPAIAVRGRESGCSEFVRCVLRYATHLAMIMLAILAFFRAHSTYPSVKPAGYLAQRQQPLLHWAFAVTQMAQESPSGRGGARESTSGEAITDTQPLTSFRTAGLGAAGLDTSIEISRPRSLALSLGTGDLLRAPVFHTTIPERLRREVITYVVERGDTVGAIAVKFDLEAETVMWANGNLAQNPDLLRPGQELVILPIDGVYHTVLQGDTLEKIATKVQGRGSRALSSARTTSLDPEAPVSLLATI